MDPLLLTARKVLFESLLRGCLTVDINGVPSNADKSQKSSREIARKILKKMGGKAQIKSKAAGQTAGNEFEEICTQFIRDTFPKLGHLRPGNWEIAKVASRRGVIIAQYEQYSHLLELDEVAKANQTLAAALGNDYSISPDIVVLRHPEEDEFINKDQLIVGPNLGTHSPLRLSVNRLPLLHASVSCKWTLRSDRAQNARAEALSFLRNRKGRAPHIVVITAEPTPSRIASIALGTGDIDCVYHIALPELEEAVKETGNDEAENMLGTLIAGKRLKDISDLPLDLSI
ncbi:MAG: restriction endonuclease [Bacteroidetes bacterium]|nr:MAG: restriction endonuclease [Bacteroidota bacterium]